MVVTIFFNTILQLVFGVCGVVTVGRKMMLGLGSFVEVRSSSSDYINDFKKTIKKESKYHEIEATFS